MSALLLDWAQAAAAGAAVAGGKGWQLARMAALGVAVPEGFVVAAQASLGRAPGQPVPEALQALLAAELQRRGWSERALAVRSSAPQEDSARASFAGIHRSCLNLRGAQALAEAVAEVWDSAHAPAALAYRQRLGLPPQDTAMAVVVMPLLPAVASGVAFTCDPASGREDQHLVHAHWGLGEAVVGGQAEADSHRLQWHRIDDRLELIEQRIGAKRRYTRVRADGGTELADTPREDADRAVLSPAQAEQVAALALDAARALDFARPLFDVEWVWDGARIWIVQARPVTATARHTYPALRRRPEVWTRGNTREILPEPLSAMDWSVYRTAADRMLTLGYELGGYPVLAGVPHAALRHGRVYLQASLIQWEGYDAYGIAPEAMNGFIGGAQAPIRVPAASLGQRLRRGLRMLRYLRRSSRHRRRAAAELAQTLERARQWRERDLSQGDRGLAALLREQVRQVRAADALFFLQGSAGGSLSGLVDLVEKHCPGEGQGLVAALMAGAAPSVTAQQGYALMALAKVAAADAPAQAWLRAPGREDGQWRRGLREDSPFRREFERFLEQYGHRAVAESYLRSPRWREQPGYLFDMALALADRDAETLRRRQREASAQAWRRVRERLPALLRPVLRFLLRSAVTDSNQREAARSALMACFEGLRRTALALGVRLAGEGGLERAEDAFELDAAELCAAAEGLLPLPAARARAQARRALRLEQARTPEPEVLVEHADASADASADTDAGTHLGDGACPRRQAAQADAGEGWRGTPIGGGRAQGRARILHDPREAGALQDGDVLVAASTDPAWTPLFLKAGALVMETGGYLSHGAIVAREFGLPAVANLPGLLAELREGERLDVDGDRGWVRRLPG